MKIFSRAFQRSFTFGQRSLRGPQGVTEGVREPHMAEEWFAKALEDPDNYGEPYPCRGPSDLVLVMGRLSPLLVQSVQTSRE